jgi:hypothetical protein
MKPEESFDQNLFSGNDSTDKRQTSPLGTSGSDSSEKPEANLTAKALGISKPETGPLDVLEKSSDDKNVSDEKAEASPITAVKAETAPPLPAKTETIEKIEAVVRQEAVTASNAVDTTEDKTDPYPPSLKTEIAARTEAAGATGGAAKPAIESSPTGVATATTVDKAATLAASTSDITDKTALPVTAPLTTAPKPAGTTTHRLDGIKPEPGSKLDTYVLTKNRSIRAMLEKHPSRTLETAPPEKIVTLMIRGVAERIALSSNSIILGRAELQSRGFQPDVDLSPYGAQMRGVSRVHARMFLQDKHLYIADLYSTNGTYIAGRRLEPNDPYRLHNGVEVLLGSLMLQVMFE